MAKNMHGFEIIVNADKSDWGIKWGLAPVGDPLCWCYECSMTRPTKREPDSLKAGDSSLPDVVKSESNLPTFHRLNTS